jgi:SAM-dependent methyltransferase
VTALYDRIGTTYARTRRPDPRFEAAVWRALGGAASVVNVGAGAGAYEPPDRRVAAVEPSAVMIAQRPPGAAPALRARAEALPFADDAFDAAMAILTVHHWSDPARGLAECARVARDRVVILTWDPDGPGFWLTRDYFPEIVDLDRGSFLSIGAVARALGGAAEVRPLPVPADCADGFLGAFWRRPEAYFAPAVRAGISAFARIPDPAPALARLRADLDSGAWAARNADLLARDELDIGYRLVVADVRGV